MKNTDFNWIAPRYLDGEASDAERRSIETRLLSDTEAQRSIELLEQESNWMGAAFQRPAEDISRIVIRVRRRNPHRRLYVSPVLAVAIQVMLLGGLIWLMNMLTSQIAPPDVQLVEIDEAVEIGGTLYEPVLQDGASTILPTTRIDEIIEREKRRDETFNPASLRPEAEYVGLEGYEIDIHQALSTLDEGQIRFRLGIGDEVNLNRSSQASVLRPQAGAHHVVALSRGELWARMINSSKRFRFTLPELPGVVLDGNLAELNLNAGEAASRAVLPRGFDLPDGKLPAAVLRVLDGAVTLRSKGESNRVTPGQTWVVYGDGSLSGAIADPDRDHYALLRRTEGRFRHQWRWASRTSYPLARQHTLYPLWRELMGAVGEIQARAEIASQRSDQAAIDDFLQLAARAEELGDDPTVPRIEGAIDWNADAYVALRKRMLDQVRASGDDFSFDQENLEDNPSLMLVIRESVEPMLDAWEQQNIDWSPPFSEADYVALFDADGITGVTRALDLFALRLQARTDKARRELNKLARPMIDDPERPKESVPQLRASLAAVKAQLSSTLDSKYLDPDGSRREALRKREGELEGERSYFLDLQNEVDRIVAELDGPSQRLEALKRDLSRALDDLAAMDRSISQVEGEIERNPYTQELLSQAQQAEAARRNDLAQAKQYLQSCVDTSSELAERREQLSTQLSTLSTKIGEAVQKQTQLDARMMDLLADISVQRREVGNASEALKQARRALYRLPEDKREGSIEARHSAKAEATLAAAQSALELLEEDYTQALQELVDTVALRRTLTDEEQVLKNVVLQEVVKDEEAIKAELAKAEQEVTEAESALTAAEAEAKRQMQLKVELEENRTLLDSYRENRTPLQEDVDTLQTSVSELDEKLQPKRDRLQELNQEIREGLDPIKQSLEEVRAEISMINGIERQISEQRDDVEATQSDLIEVLNRLLTQHAELGGDLTRTARRVPAEIDELYQERFQQSTVVADASLEDAERVAAQEEMIAIGDQLVEAMRTELAREITRNQRTADILGAQALAHQWLAWQAGKLRERVLRESDQAVREYRYYLEDRLGFPITQAENATAEGAESGESAEADDAGEAAPTPAERKKRWQGQSVYQLLTSYANPANAPVLDEEHRAEVLELMWELFTSVEVESMREEQQRMAKEERVIIDMSVAPYLTALRAVDRAQALRSIDTAWVNRATPVFAEAEREQQAREAEAEE